MTMRTVEFVRYDAEALAADLYLPDAAAPAPVLIALHGGGWKGGTRASYRHIGAYLARSGYALCAIDYRLVSGERNRYPAAADDARAAAAYVRDHAGELNVDPARLVLMGDSAGGHLAALVALTAPREYAAVVGVYGVYDMASQWQHDLLSRPNDNIAQAFLGVSLVENRRLYFETSPLSYAIAGNAGPSFLLAWGTHDDIVDPAQSEAFMLALKQAGFYVRPVIQDAAHFWIGDPLDDPGSHSAYFAARLLRFLQDRVPAAR